MWMKKQGAKNRWNGPKHPVFSMVLAKDSLLRIDLNVFFKILLFKLGVVEFFVKTFLLEKFRMGSGFDDIALV